jgi:hypothetical protein
MPKRRRVRVAAACDIRRNAHSGARSGIQFGRRAKIGASAISGAALAAVTVSIRTFHIG